MALNEWNSDDAVRFDHNMMHRYDNAPKEDEEGIL